VLCLLHSTNMPKVRLPQLLVVREENHPCMPPDLRCQGATHTHTHTPYTHILCCPLPPLPHPPIFSLCYPHKISSPAHGACSLEGILRADAVGCALLCHVTRASCRPAACNMARA
jgi:hypothetical protein